MDFAVDWNAVCLVCLQEGDMRSIFEKDDKNMSLCDKIMHCSSIEIQRGTNLPEQICSRCIDDLNAAYRFRTNCESTNLILKSFLNSTITDLELPTSNGQVYKYKLPTGLNVKRIKSSNAFDVKVKEEQVVDDDHQSQYEEHFAENDDDDFNEKDEDEPDISDAKQLAEDILKERCETYEIDHDDAHEYEIKTEKLEPSKKTKTKLKIEPKETSQSKVTPKTAPKPKIGRPKSNIKQTNLTEVITPDNVSEFVQDLTTVTYVRKNREDEKPLKICDICGNGYKYQHALESHMRRHRNERPFSCEFCDRAFVANVELRRHMRVHTGQKPYPCRYCDRRFSDFGSRIKHERTHTGERPYECSTCGKAFAYAHVLSVHILTHTGEKKFKCEVCGKGFTKKVYLKTHMRLHNEVPPQQIICEMNLNDIKTNDNIQEIQMIPVLQYTMDSQNVPVKVEDINILEPKPEAEEVEISMEEFKVTTYVPA